MDVTQLLGYIGAFIVGLVLGLIGGGGSILTVPILVYLLGYNPIVATAYSLFVVGSSSLVGTVQKYRKGLADLKIGLAFSFPSFLAVYLSRRFLVPGLPDVLFKINDYELTKEIGIMVFFGFVMLLAGFSMIKNKKKEVITYKKQPYYYTFIQGIVIGTITGIIGAGGGFLYVPALVLWANLPMKKAVGTSLIIITINSLIGFTGDLHTIDIDWMFLISFSLITIMGILIGGRLSKRISNKSLKKGFGYFVFAMAIYIIYKELTL
ncbi:sulfite exporter TauE/SafE family protein [Geojedonia litorea]|uniref:Probable membrane transporter protein n=1 Tax=Geojedonia litorea TaxID=1268269 RepID=A0ABV9N1Z9_9FLAO